MTPILFDAVTPGNIPATATEVAGYVDGKYKWSAADWARFTLATVRWRITAIPMNTDADVCDCENGDYSPTQAAMWAKAVIQLGRRPIIYCSESIWNQVQWQLSLLGISGAAVDWWIAAYNNSPTLVPGIPNEVAHQFEDAGPYDESVVTGGPSTIPPVALEDDPMRIFDTAGQPTYWWTGTNLVGPITVAELGYVRDELGVEYKELSAAAYAFAVASFKAQEAAASPLAPEHFNLTVSPA